MFRKPFNAWLYGLACLLLAGCGGVSVSVLLFDEFPHDDVRPIAFQNVLPAVDSAIGDRRLVVVRDLVAWDGLWRAHTIGLVPLPTLPPINFAQQMVIGVFSGVRNNPCIDIEIRSVWHHTRPERIEVNYREVPRPPDVNGQCTSGMRNPAALIVLTYSHLPVEFFPVS
ncbi:hypothetical protein [Janthinobacterium sp. 17J80-10]|uniref:hypothetical protein n=1 Tax=Janthinobacterium sp. 17J80-10 TaxID=2497863 RepID=UPI0010054863|nr:hypothetical protein [Janthinobacterium sp. 17J80-10]QAU35417.1 hypothetical protein EKL02_15250 [Janthinobacterium sp. 17J80-10]